MTLIYEFETLDQLIRLAHPTKLLEIPADGFKARQLEWMDTIDHETKRICHKFHEVYYNTEHMDLVVRYFRLQLKAAADLIESLKNYLQDQRVQERDDLSAFYHHGSATIGRIVEYLLKHFEDSFDFETAIPPTLCLKARDELGALADRLFSQFLQYPELKGLIDVIIQPVQRFLDVPGSSISYRLYYYYRYFLHVLLQLRPKDNEDANLSIHIVCTFLNFNYPPYLTFCIDRLQEKMKNHPIEAKMVKLRWYIKSIQQAEKTHGLNIATSVTHSAMARLKKLGRFAPEPDAETVADQMGYWVRMELEYLEYMFKVEQEAAGATNGKVPFKISTKLTVWQLAVFTEVFIAIKVFLADSSTSYSQTLKGVASIVSTRGSDEMSSESLRSKASFIRNIKSQKQAQPQKAKIAIQSLEECHSLFFECFKLTKQWLRDATIV